MDAEVLKAKLIEKGVDLVCPLCKSVSFFAISGRYTALLTNEMDKKGINVDATPIIPALTMICENCGYIILLSLSVFESTKKEDITKKTNGGNGSVEKEREDAAGALENRARSGKELENVDGKSQN